jgi:hypothetical protein
MRTSSPTMAVPFFLPFTLTLALSGSLGIHFTHHGRTFVRNGTHRRRQSKVLRRRMKACSLRSRDSRSLPNETGFYSIPEEICHQILPAIPQSRNLQADQGGAASLSPLVQKPPRESLRIHPVQVDSHREFRSRVFHPVATVSL